MRHSAHSNLATLIPTIRSALSQTLTLTPLCHTADTPSSHPTSALMCRFIAVVCAKDGELHGSQAGSVASMPVSLTYFSGAQEHFRLWAVPQNVKVRQVCHLWYVWLCSPLLALVKPTHYGLAIGVVSRMA